MGWRHGEGRIKRNETLRAMNYFSTFASTRNLGDGSEDVQSAVTEHSTVQKIRDKSWTLYSVLFQDICRCYHSSKWAKGFAERTISRRNEGVAFDRTFPPS